MYFYFKNDQCLGYSKTRIKINDATEIQSDLHPNGDLNNIRLIDDSIVIKDNELLTGFEWQRASDGGVYQVSVTQQDSIALLLEVQADFDLQAAMGVVNPVSKFIKFANGTIINDLTPVERQEILMLAAPVRRAIELKFS